MRAIVQPFGIDKFHLLDPHQPQYRAQIGRDGVGSFSLVNTAAAADDHRPDALHQPLRPALGVAKGFPRPRHEVEPFFKIGRDVEVIHRRADHQQVAGL